MINKNIETADGIMAWTNGQADMQLIRESKIGPDVSKVIIYEKGVFENVAGIE